MGEAVRAMIPPGDTHGFGVRAYEEGRALTSNPYDRGTRRHREWEGGYLDAAEADHVERRSNAAPSAGDGAAAAGDGGE